MDIYAKNIMDNYKNTRNRGCLNDPKVSGKEANRSCGDNLAVDLRIENDKIIDLKFDGQGCAISIGAMSILSEHLIGQEIDQVLDLVHQDVLKLLGVEIGGRRFKCVLLGLLTVQNIIWKNQNKETRTWDDLM